MQFGDRQPSRFENRVKRSERHVATGVHRHVHESLSPAKDDVRAALAQHDEACAAERPQQRLRTNVREFGTHRALLAMARRAGDVCAGRLRCYDDRFEPRVARILFGNVHSSIATVFDREPNRIARHLQRILDALPERVNLWEGRNDDPKDILIRFEEDGITQSGHASSLRLACPMVPVERSSPHKPRPRRNARQARRGPLSGRSRGARSGIATFPAFPEPWQRV